ncbi:hypothetical protein Fmac_002774 [Flemingia macrophylla]|uniref:Beta-amylase n=1 Tax=Flemingia macrophylla TaxID=520843 RepID=A0ABD1NKX6_9FABA
MEVLPTDKAKIKIVHLMDDFKKGKRLIVVMAFHERGGNNSSDALISLPQWVLDMGKDNQDIFFTVREGRKNTECLSWENDEESPQRQNWN